MAYIKTPHALLTGHQYPQAITHAHKLLKRSADRWTKGNPFDPSPEEELLQILNLFIHSGFIRLQLKECNRSCLTWNGSTIPKLAKVIEDERSWENLPILADALEEAGCTNADMPAHCRKPGQHERRCAVVQLLLGRVVSSLCFLPRMGLHLTGAMTQAVEGHEIEEDTADTAIIEAYSVWCDAVVDWTQGDPEDPPTEQILTLIHDILVQGKLLRLPYGVGSVKAILES